MNDERDAPWGSVETRFERIHSAARMRDVETVRSELASGVPVDIENGRAENGDGGNTALWFAAQGAAEGGLEVAIILVEAGAVIDRPCEHGWTALHMAACWGHLDIVQFLIEQGADRTLQDTHNRTAKDLASVSNCAEADDLQRIIDYLQSLDE